MNQIELLKVMIESACSDGSISEDELFHLQKKANEANISKEDLNFLIQTELKKIHNQNTVNKSINDQSGFINNENNSGFVKENTTISNTQKTNEIFSDITNLETQGAMSLIQKAKYLGSKWLIIKRIKPEFKTNKIYIELFEKEFENIFELDHQNIVRVYGRGDDANGLYYFMEYVDGRTLTEMISNNEFKDEKIFRNIINQILDALIYVHKKQIYHRDLKPDNILITFKGDNVKILDFGLANADTFIDNLQKVGTPKYSSPESKTNGSLTDQRSDIYSLGVIMLEMLTLTTDIKKLTDIKNLMFKQIIQKCINEKPNNRYTSCQEIKNLFFTPSSKKTIPDWLEQKIIEFTTDGKITPNEKKVLDLEAQSNGIDIAAMNAVINLYLEKAKERLAGENEKNSKLLKNNTVKTKSKRNFFSFYRLIRIFVLLMLISSIGYISYYFYPQIKNSLKSDKSEKYQKLTEKKIMYTNAKSLNLRKTATTDGDIIGTFPLGTEVVVTEIGYYWARIEVNGLDGYMYLEYLDEDKPK